MPFGIPKDGFWGSKELSYQHVHMFWSFWVAYFIHFFFPVIYIFPIVGLTLGIFMEVYQNRDYIKYFEIPRSWVDSIRDLCFWILGACLNYIIIFTRK
jgi:hypothetical protein